MYVETKALDEARRDSRSWKWTGCMAVQPICTYRPKDSCYSAEVIEYGGLDTSLNPAISADVSRKMPGVPMRRTRLIEVQSWSENSRHLRVCRDLLCLRKVSSVQRYKDGSSDSAECLIE